MQIWVDADACPKPVKEVLFNAARRKSVELTLVANHALSTPPSPLIRALVVAHGFDSADDHIIASAEAGDVLITADIPLAAKAVAKGLWVLGPRGERFTPDNISQRLAMRDFFEEMRSTGQVFGGPAAFEAKDKQAFANALDRLLAKL